MTEEQIHNMCGRKRNYPHLGAAWMAAKVMESKDNERMKAYPCPVCGGWHVGHKNKRRTCCDTH